MGRKLIYELITNRFGIVLAAINGAFFAGRIAKSFPMDHRIGETIFLCMNLPAIFSTVFAGSFVQLFFNPNSHTARNSVPLMLFSLFLVFQWLLIAHIAKIGADFVKTKWNMS